MPAHRVADRSRLNRARIALRSGGDLVGCEGARVVYWALRARYVPTARLPRPMTTRTRVLACAGTEPDPTGPSYVVTDTATVLEGWTAS